MFFPTNRTCEDVATKDECALPCADGVRIPTDKGGCQDQPVGTEKKPYDKQASCVKADSHSAKPDANKLRDLLPELLVREEQASPEQIKHALKEQEKTGRFIGGFFVNGEYWAKRAWSRSWSAIAATPISACLTTSSMRQWHL